MNCVLYIKYIISILLYTLSIKYVIHQPFWSNNEPLSNPGLSLFYLLSDRLKLFNQHFIFLYVYRTGCTNNDVTRDMGT